MVEAPAAGKKKKKKPAESLINSRTQDEDTPLHWGAASGDESVVRTLVEVPAIDVNAQNKDGNTPLHVACAEGALEVVQVDTAPLRVSSRRKPSPAGDNA